MLSQLLITPVASLTLLAELGLVSQLPTIPQQTPVQFIPTVKDPVLENPGELPLLENPGELPLPNLPVNPKPREVNDVSPNDGLLLNDGVYRLGPGDVLQLDVFGVPQYSGNQLVALDGTINLQVIGRIQVTGLTVAQAQDIISSRYAPFLRRPLVTLVLVEPRPLQIAVAGEVFRPGSYTLTAEGGRQFPTLTQALQLAGGITQSAEVSEIVIQRGLPNQPAISVNLWELTQSGDLTQDPILFDGDSIFVPTTESFDLAQARQLESTTISPQVNEPIQVVLVGEVLRPGPYTVAAGGGVLDPPTVTRAIELSGGITDLADLRRVEVRRITRTGFQTIDIDLWELLRSGDIDQDLVLQAGDTIAIPTAREIDPADVETLASASFAPDLIQVNVVGEVTRPGAVQVTPNTPLNQALLAAGGFDPTRSSDSSVELIRLNPDGTVSRREISVDFEQGINTEGNPVLRNNDVVVVNRNFITGVADTLGEILRPVTSLFILQRLFQ